VAGSLRHAVGAAEQVCFSMDADNLNSLDITGPEKGEIHVHLNGLVPSRLVREILHNEGAVVPLGFDLDFDLVRRLPCDGRRKPRWLARLQRARQRNVANSGAIDFDQTEAASFMYVLRATFEALPANPTMHRARATEDAN
jgi:hypothetical protein